MVKTLYLREVLMILHLTNKHPFLISTIRFGVE